MKAGRISVIPSGIYEIEGFKSTKGINTST